MGQNQISSGRGLQFSFNDVKILKDFISLENVLYKGHVDG